MNVLDEVFANLRINRLREFAVPAMQGIISSHTGEVPLPEPAVVATKAFNYAEAMLVELERRKAAKEQP